MIDQTRKSIVDLAPITSPYGDTSGRSVPHNGIDVGVPIGTALDTQVGGQVERTLYDRIGGTQVIVKTPQGFEEVFAHLSNIAVSIGDVLQPGQVIGYSGASGDVTGPHVHYEIRNPSGGTMDPVAFLSEFVPGFASEHPSHGGSSTSGGLTALPASAPTSSGPTCPAGSVLRDGVCYSAGGFGPPVDFLPVPIPGTSGYQPNPSTKGEPSGLLQAAGTVLATVTNPKRWAQLAFTLVGVGLIVTGVLFYTKTLTTEKLIALQREGEGAAAAGAGV